MYTILMNEYKDLIHTEKTTLYQREKLVDKIQFLFPIHYHDLDLSQCTFTLKYVDAANVAHTEILTLDEELYKNSKLRCVLPIDTNLSNFAGDIRCRITIAKVDLLTKSHYVLHTSETLLTILPLTDYFEFIPDESLEVIDQMIGKLDAKINSVNVIAETYDRAKADNITFADNTLQLTSNGSPIGTPIALSDHCDCNTEIDQVKDEAVDEANTYTDDSLTIIEI